MKTTTATYSISVTTDEHCYILQDNAHQTNNIERSQSTERKVIQMGRKKLS